MTLIARSLLALALPAVASAAALPPAPPGFCDCKWNDAGYHTPKYDIGRILAAFPHTAEGLKQALPAIQAMFPGTQFAKKPDGTNSDDKINVPCVNSEVDVIASLHDPDPSKTHWAWQAPEKTNLCGTCSGARKNICDPPPQHRCACVCDHPKPAWCGGGGGGGGGGGKGGGEGECEEAANCENARGVVFDCGPGNGRFGDQSDRRDVVAQAKADLVRAGLNLHNHCGPFAITKLAACRLRGTGAGLLHKPGGNRCDDFATDILVWPDGKHYDVVGSGGTKNDPTWQDIPNNVDPSRYRPAPTQFSLPNELCTIQTTCPTGSATSHSSGSSSHGTQSHGGHSGGAFSGGGNAGGGYHGSPAVPQAGSAHSQVIGGHSDTDKVPLHGPGEAPPQEPAQEGGDALE